MFNTNSAHKAILCPKNFLIVLTALVCILSSAVVSAQEARMRSIISDLGVIPGNSCDANIALPDESCLSVASENLDDDTGNILSRFGPNNTQGIGIVDWVVVELRVFGEGATATGNVADADMIYRQPALLRSDGTVINANAANLLATDGDDSILTLGFEGFDDSTQDAYIIIEHRTHRGLMSANPVVPEVEYNFGESADQIRGGADSSKLKNGVYSASGGSLLHGPVIDGSDRNRLTSNLFVGTGYLSADIDLNQIVDGTDRSLLTGSLFIGSLGYVSDADYFPSE